jgi:hypothetical protein
LGEKDEMPVEQGVAALGGDAPNVVGGMKRNLSYPKLNLEDLNAM